MDKETEHSKDTLPPIEEVVIKCEIIEESDEELRLYQPTEQQKEQIVPVAVPPEVSLLKPKEKRTRIHGDLNGSCSLRGRVVNKNAMRKWIRLTDALNADHTGTQKSQVRWKKVWSDFKNNARKKAARWSIDSEPGLILSPLEQRVMNLITSEGDKSVAQVADIDMHDTQWNVLDASPNVEEKDAVDDSSSDSCESSNSEHKITTSESILENDSTPALNTEADPLAELPATSNPPKWRHLTIRKPLSTRILRPAQPLVLRQIPNLDPEERKYQKEKELREYNLEKERLRLRGIELQQQASSAKTITSEFSRTQFPMSDSEWRSYLKEKDLHDYELEKERLRLREIELQQQSHWQELFAQFLSIANKVADKYTENKDYND